MSSVVTWILLLRLVNLSLSYQVYQEVPYKEVGFRTLYADLYIPTGTNGPVPAVVVVHGGMWDYGKRTDNADLAAHVASNRLAVVLIDFRDAATAGFDGQIVDIRDAIRWVRANADSYNIDPGRIGLLGFSSGAHLASLVAFAGNGGPFGDDPPGASSRVDASMFVYGVYDLAAAVEAGGPAVPVVEWYVGGTPSSYPEGYTRYSALTYLDASDPPTLLVHGADDSMAPVAQAEELKAALENAGVPVELMLVPGLGHGFLRKQPWLRPPTAEITAAFFHQSLGE